MVFCPDSPDLQSVLLLIGNTRGLHADSANQSHGSVLVSRGAKHEYSFTVAGPFRTTRADIAEQVLDTSPDVDTLFLVHVEGSDESEIPHGIRFARKLAKACHGVVLDEQTSELWPTPRARPSSEPEVYPRADAVELAWYCLADEIPADLPGRYLRLAQAFLPEAIPIRFGTYHPPQGDFSRDGEEGFARAWQQSVGTSFGLDTRYPVTWVSLDSVNQLRPGDVRAMRMTVAREALEEIRFRSTLKDFFIGFAREIGAFHATAEVVRNYMRYGDKLLGDNSAELFRSLVFVFRSSELRNEWVGLKPYPVWWSWYGRLYEESVRPYLIGQVEQYPDGVFHALCETPHNRDALAELLPDPGQPMFPAEYCAVYDGGELRPLSLASKVPPRLREVTFRPH